MLTEGSGERHVLVLAPSGRDAVVVERLLARAGVESRACADAQGLAREIRAGAGAALVAEEALGGSAERAVVSEALAAQAEWSDLPMILLATAGGDARALEESLSRSAGCRSLLLERPLRSSTLVAAVRTALQSRRRQYQVRDELARRRQAERALRAAVEREQRWSAELEREVAERTATLRRQRENLRRLALELTLVEHHERQELSDALHGGIQQMLIAIRIQLQGWAERGALGDVPKILDLLDQAVTSARSLASDLTLPVLDHSTLAEDVRWLGDWFAEKQHLRVRVQVVEPLPAPGRDVRIFVLRALRELLQNVVKHAGVAEARVVLRSAGDQLCVEVQDEGAGFDLAALERGRRDGASGLGLFSIGERAEALGGSLFVETSPDAGTRLRLSVPTRESDA